MALTGLGSWKSLSCLKMLRCSTNNTTSNDNIVWQLGVHWARYHHTLRNWLTSILLFCTLILAELSVGQRTSCTNVLLFPCPCRLMSATSRFQSSIHVLQGGRYFTGHWFYSLWNTALAVTRQDGSKVDPVFLEPHRIFRASHHDNQAYAAEGCTTQSLNAIAK